MRADFAEPARIAPAAGRMLLALPSLQDENFAGSVVYLLESDGEAGSAGVVINVPTRTPVGQVLPGWHDRATEPSVIFRGGPVQLDGALCLGRLVDSNEPAPGLRTVRQRFGSSGVALIDLDGDVEQISRAVNGLRVFAGHAGWSGGQLEAEIAQGAWLVVRGQADYVFSEQPQGLWRQIMRAQPSRIAWLSTYPGDPTLN